MARKRVFRVLIATDGSSHAQAAITTAMRFPWPACGNVRYLSKLVEALATAMTADAGTP